MRRIRSAMMRTPFAVHTRSVVVNEFGANDLTYTASGTTVWGYLRGINAQETVEREGITHARTYEIMVRAQDESAVPVTARLVTGGRTFEVEGVQQYDDSQRTITLRAREII
jgi:head-tail adaptor